MVAQKKSNIKRLSILLFMVDGLAQTVAETLLKKTYNYLLEDQDGIILHGLQKVGENTFPNMIPFLTGN
mgnify:CR=1 FL=1